MLCLNNSLSHSISMKLKFILIIAILTVDCFILRSQSKFQRLESCDSIPAENFIRSYKKYYAAKKNILLEKKRSERLIYDQFHMQQNYMIDRFQMSGEVLYGDAISKYINKVAKVLLQNDTILQKKLKFYVVKSSCFNAFATYNGNIYVNIGLMARVKNEAQLAYILSHEIIHYTKQHVINGYVHSEKIRLGIENSKNDNLSKEITEKHNYSQNLEFQADSLGFLIFSNTNYDAASALDAINSLNNANAPYDLVKFNWAIKEFEPLSALQNSNLLGRGKNVVEDNDTSSERNEPTHPKVTERAKVVQLMINSRNTKKGQLFIVSENDFYRVREIARLELSELYLNEMKYESAIYNDFLLLQNHPNDLYIKKNLARAFNAMTLVLSYDNFAYTKPDPADSTITVLRNALYGFGAKKLNMMTVNYCLHKRLEFKQDSDLATIAKNTMHYLVSNYSDWIDSASINSSLLPEEAQLDSLLRDTGFTTLRNLNQKPEIAKIIKSKKNILVISPFAYVFTERYSGTHLDYVESEKMQIFYDSYLKKYKSDNVNFILLSPTVMTSKDVDKYNDLAFIKQYFNNVLEFEKYGFSTSDEEAINNFKRKYNVDYILYTGDVSLNKQREISDDAVIMSFIIPFSVPFFILPKFFPKKYSESFSTLIDINKGKSLFTFSEELNMGAIDAFMHNIAEIEKRLSAK